MVVVGSLAAAAICALVVWQVMRSGRKEPALAFGASDCVLVTAFENHTGEPVFTGTLEYVLRQQLSASSFVRVASPDRVRDALSLMRRPLDTPVDVPIGREISQRDGAIRVLVAGRIDKLSDRYVLGVELVSTVDGRSVAVDRRTVNRQDQVLEAVAAQAERRPERGDPHGEMIRRFAGRVPDLEAGPADVERVRVIEEHVRHYRRRGRLRG